MRRTNSPLATRLVCRALLATNRSSRVSPSGGRIRIQPYAGDPLLAPSRWWQPTRVLGPTVPVGFAVLLHNRLSSACRGPLAQGPAGTFGRHSAPPARHAPG